MKRVSLAFIGLVAILVFRICDGYRFDDLLAVIANIVLPVAIALKGYANARTTGSILKELY